MTVLSAHLWALSANTRHRKVAKTYKPQQRDKGWRVRGLAWRSPPTSQWSSSEKGACIWFPQNLAGGRRVGKDCEQMLAGHKIWLWHSLYQCFLAKGTDKGAPTHKGHPASFSAMQEWQSAQETAQSAACQSRKSPLALFGLLACYFGS